MDNTPTKNIKNGRHANEKYKKMDKPAYKIYKKWTGGWIGRKACLYTQKDSTRSPSRTPHAPQCLPSM